MKTNKPKNNPYAFPQTEFNDNTHSDYNGMTLRDYFANSAMQSIITNEKIRNAIDKGTETGEEMNKKIALTSYQLADAMLKQREL